MTRILLVGVDEKTALSLREAVGGQKGYVIKRCKAEEAQIVVQRAKPNVILLNIARPEVSRLHLLQEFKKSAQDIPVIVIADKLSTSLAIKAMKEGAFDYVIKPLELAQVRALLAEQQLEVADLTTAEAAAETGRILNVPAVLVVSIPHVGEEISMTAKIVDVEDGSFLWMGSGSGKSGGTLGEMFGFIPGVGGEPEEAGAGDEMFTEVMGGVFGEMADRALSPAEERHVRQLVRKICRSLPERPAAEEW